MTMIKQTRLWVLAAFMTLWAGLAWSAGGEEELAPEIPAIDEVREVIEAQLLAFQTSDGAGAFFHAAPGIQSAFGGPEPFMAMVQRGYNVIYENNGWTFEESRVDGDNAAQIVTVEDATGRSIKVVYYLGRLSGFWKITGVQRIEDPGAAT